MTEQTPEQQFVDKYYIMNPVEDELLFDSRELREGMLVLAANFEDREGTAVGIVPMSQERYAKCMQWNRWMVVSHLFQENDLVHFIGNYNDGTKMKFSVNPRKPWLLKKVPGGMNSQRTGAVYAADPDPLTSPDWPPANRRTDLPVRPDDTKPFTAFQA